MKKIAYVVTHPIQYQAPLLRWLAAGGEVELKGFFLSDFSLRIHHEKAFGQSFQWDVPLTEGYEWEVLPRWGNGGSHHLRSWWPVRRLKERFKAGRFDAVWVHGWGHVGLRQAMSAANSLGIPLLLRGESTPDPSSRQTLRRRLRNHYCRKLFPRVAGFLCIGSLNREFYCNFGVPQEKLFSMPYAVDNTWFQAHCQKAALRREAFRQELGLEPGRKIFLFVGRFIPAKAPADLLAAFQRAWSKALKAKPYLLFVGDGPLRPDLEKQAGALGGNDVRFLGFRNQTELPAFYDLCDVFILPSHFEPWGLVVNEAMNARKPAILSDRVGAAPDLLEPGVNGWIFPHGEIGALERCLAGAVQIPELGNWGQRSLEIINRWDFTADSRGLQAALATVCPGKKPAYAREHKD